MSNLLSLYSDYEKRYNTWLKNSAVPNVKGWYDQSGIDERLKGFQTGLLGQEQRTMHPSEGVISTFQGGGYLDTAGGKINEALLGKKARTMHPKEGVLEGVGYQPQIYDPKFDATKDKWKDQGRVTEGLINKSLRTGLEVTKDVFNWSKDKLDEQFDIMFPNANKNISNKDKKNAIANSPEYTDEILRKKGLTQQDGFSLSKWVGVDMDDVKKNWKDKGGFEGLMSNPAFTLGLALMQSSAQGKTIGEDLMNNFIKGAKLSEHYKDRLAAKAGDVIQATEGQMENIETILEGMNIKKPLFSKVLKGNQAAQWEEAVESIANEVETRVRKMKKAAGTKDVVVNTTLKKKIIKQMEADGFFKRRKGAFGVSDTLYMEGKAEGGPVKAGQPYVVGEKGPEVVIPKADANVVSNDDSQVMGMLLASNPQLQNVSKARAESILRSRFPDYFA